MQADSQVLHNSKSDLKSRKANYVVFIGKAFQRSDMLLSKVKAVGPPAVKNGATLQSNLESAIRAVRKSFAAAVPGANALPTTSQPTFSRGVHDLSKDPGKKLAAMGQTFNQLHNKDKSLNKAMSQDAACQKLRKGRA
jgi:hypothetical protein